VVSGARVVAGIVSAVLDLIAMKPIAIFVWWLSNCANRIESQERVRSEIVEELGKLRTERASASRSGAGEVFR